MPFYSDRYDQEIRGGWSPRDHGGGRYDAAWWETMRGGYGPGYKSEWRRDHGDPFGDRRRTTPIRSMEGPFEPRSGGRGRPHHGRRDFRPYGARPRYDREWWW